MLNNLSVIVTGGGRGIGRAVALELAGRGARVVVAARSEGQLKSVAEIAHQRGQVITWRTVDVRDYHDCERLATFAMDSFGTVDVLINNAGGGILDQRVEDVDPEAWADTVSLNLVGMFNCTHAVLSSMIEQKSGRIVNIGSGVGHAASAGASAYGAAKAGVSMFTKVLSEEVWKYGIDVNEVIPGPVETALTASTLKVGVPSPHSASERVKSPAEVAKIIVWLLELPVGGPTGQVFSLCRRPVL